MYLRWNQLPKRRKLSSSLIPLFFLGLLWYSFSGATIHIHADSSIHIHRALTNPWADVCEQPDALTVLKPADLERWQQERYSSEKFQLGLENPQPKCSGEAGSKIHNELLDDIWQMQHPSDCSNANFLIWRLGHGGFGQEVRKLAYQLAIAYAEGRTLILDTSVPWKYTDKEICPDQSYFCYFEPITHCKMSDVHALLRSRGLSSTDIPVWEENSDPGAPVLMGNYNTDKWRFHTPTKYGTLLSLEWYRSEILGYLMRPNEFTNNIITRQKDRLASNGLFGTQSLPCIAMHVRGGDKKTEYKLHPFQEYLNKAKWFKLLYGVNKIFLVTDDSTVIDQSEEHDDFTYYFSDGDREAGGSQEITEVGYKVMEKVLKDIFIGSQCQFWIGTLSSNFGDVIWEIMVARNHGTVPPFASLDIPWTTHNQPNVFI